MQILNEKELTKAYYSIGEVSQLFNVNASLIRFWHKEFSIIQPKINKKGNRLFTPKDVVNLSKIYHLVKIQGFTLDGAKKALKEKTPIESPQQITEPILNFPIDTQTVIQQLEEIKSRLLRLKSN